MNLTKDKNIFHFLLKDHVALKDLPYQKETLEKL